MIIYLQGLVIIIGIIFEICGVLYTARNSINNNLYDESGFWFGTNDNKKINEIEKKNFSIGGYIFILLGIVFQMATLFYPDKIEVIKATKSNVVLVGMSLLFITGFINFIIITFIKKSNKKKKINYIRKKLSLSNANKSRLNANDAVRYINYVVSEEYCYKNIEKLKEDLNNIFQPIEITNIEFHEKA